MKLAEAEDMWASAASVRRKLAEVLRRMTDTGTPVRPLACHWLLGTVRPLPQEHLREVGDRGTRR